MPCSGSALWEEQIRAQALAAGEEEEFNEPADEGTAMHSLAETCVLEQRVPDDYIGEQISAQRDYEVTQERADTVTDALNYVARVIEDNWDDANLETVFKMGFLPEIGAKGTSDVSYRQDRTLHVFDYKFGRHIVEAFENPQLKLYGAGALDHAFYRESNIDTVILHVVQPRIDNFDSFKITVNDLMRWIDEEVTPAGAAAVTPNNNTVAGEWCRFCEARAVCDTLRTRVQTIAKRKEFIDTNLITKLDPVEIGKIMSQFALMEVFKTAVRDHALQEAKRGRKIPGWKLVNGKPTRRWTDEDKTFEFLADTFCEGDDYLVRQLLYAEPKIKSPAQLEADIEPLLLKRLISTDTGFTIVPEDDRRKEVNVLDEWAEDLDPQEEASGVDSALDLI